MECKFHEMSCNPIQIGADGRRSQIFLALSTAAEFRDHLSTFSDFYSSLGMSNEHVFFCKNLFCARERETL